MPAWEYKTFARSEGELLTEEQLNALGTHGFEMVGLLPVTSSHTVVGRHETRTTVHYFFKRPKPAQSAPAAAPQAAPQAPKG